MVLLSLNPTRVLICLRVEAEILAMASEVLRDLPRCSFHHWLSWSDATSFLQLLWTLCCLDPAEPVPSV